MQEMIELSKLQQEQPDNPPRSVIFFKTVNGNESNKIENGDTNEESNANGKVAVTIIAGPAQFGPQLNKDYTVLFLFFI